MQEPSSVSLQNAIATGRQLPIVGTGLAIDPSPELALAGQTLPANSTLLFALPVRGASSVDVLLRFSTVTATVPTASIYKTMADGLTEKMNAAGASAAVAFAAFVNGVQQTASVTTLRGERVVLLKIVTGANPPTIDQAEYSTL
jgi:hypothetical protein